jgi:hypothetical protein
MTSELQLYQLIVNAHLTLKCTMLQIRIKPQLNCHFYECRNRILHTQHGH